MSNLYEKQGFVDGQILYAENLIKIEDGVQAVAKELNNRYTKDEIDTIMNVKLEEISELIGGES